MKEALLSLAHCEGIQHPGFAEGGLQKIAPLIGGTVEWHDEVRSYLEYALPAQTFFCGEVCFVDLPRLQMENGGLLPGVKVARLGFVVIAVTQCGDAFAVEAENGRLYLLSTDKYEGDRIEPGWDAKHGDFLPALPLVRENVIATATAEFSSLTEWFEMLVTMRGR